MFSVAFLYRERQANVNIIWWYLMLFIHIIVNRSIRIIIDSMLPIETKLFQKFWKKKQNV